MTDRVLEAMPDMSTPLTNQGSEEKKSTYGGAGQSQEEDRHCVQSLIAAAPRHIGRTDGG